MTQEILDDEDADTDAMLASSTEDGLENMASWSTLRLSTLDSAGNYLDNQLTPNNAILVKREMVTTSVM